MNIWKRAKNLWALSEYRIPPLMISEHGSIDRQALLNIKPGVPIVIPSRKMASVVDLSEPVERDFPSEQDI